MPSATLPMKPSWGMGEPVSCSEMKMAGVMKAKIITQYWATWV